LAIIEAALTKLINKDAQQNRIFAQPVSETEVPGYSNIIKKPMDLQTMKTKLDRGAYKKVADLRADFALMIANCLTFNNDNQYFYKHGHRFKRIGGKILKAAEEEERKNSMTQVSKCC
jgi:bromodomain-containing protein 7/9